ncbi:MAG: hypothetical protein ACXABY_27465 [Candidatus Thorarchaeota archaeon]
MKPATKKEVFELLDKFCSKARCMYTQERAHTLWRQLKPYLTTDQVDRLLIAWGHHVDVREGPEELDHVRQEIKDESEAQIEAWRIGREAVLRRPVH